MGILEIGLIAAGALIFLISFCIPVKEEKLKEESRKLAVGEVRKLLGEELEAVRGRLSEISEEEVKDRIGQSERAMERISNEKIMAVNEYSDTVLTEIHKNHEEVVFLYDILKNKKQALSESYGKVDQNIQELLQEMKDSEITVREKLEEISGKIEEFEEIRKQFLAGIEEIRQQSLAGIDEMRQQSLAEFEEMRQRSLAELEGMRQQFIAGLEKERNQKGLVRTVKKAAAQPEAGKAVKFTPAKLSREVPEGASAEVPAGIPAEISAEVPAGIPAEVSAEVSAGIPAEVSAEVPAAKVLADAPEGLEIPAESTFKPFTPEKVKVVPKKAVAKKAVKKPAAGPETKSEMKPEPKPEITPEITPEPKPKARAKAASPAEGRDVKLLLSDPVADSKAGNNSNLRILKLHEQGKSNMAIARELGLGIGEVQLVIDLYEGMGIKTGSIKRG